MKKKRKAVAANPPDILLTNFIPPYSPKSGCGGCVRLKAL
jgi:transposase